MRPVAALLAAAILAGCSGESSTFTVEAVEVPADMRTVAQATAGEASIELLADGDCFRLLVEVDGRRQVDQDDRCSVGPRSAVWTRGPDVMFNDRERTWRRCEGDCPGPRPDVTLPGVVLYGRLHPPADLACADVAGTPAPLLPDPDGVVLAITPDGPYERGQPLYFLDDGRFIGSDPEAISPAAVAACRTALELPTPDIATSQWFVHVEGEDELGDDVSALSLLTDTGFDAEGAGIEVLGDGFVFRVLLHPDTTALLLHFEADRPVSSRVDLPPEVVDSLRAGTPCGMNLTLELAADLDATIRSDC